MTAIETNLGGRMNRIGDQLNATRGEVGGRIDAMGAKVDSLRAEVRTDHGTLDELLRGLEIRFAAVEHQDAAGGTQSPRAEGTGPTA